MNLSRRLRRNTLVGTATLGLLAGSTLFAGGAGAELPEGATFAFSGAADSYIVPGGVCAVEIVAAGAQGGMNDYETDAEGTSPPGGLGGVATAVVTVTPGETLQVNVGGRGGDGSFEDGGGAGGWNGGGDGGGLGYDPLIERAGMGGGGGGGASDVRQGGTTLDDRVAVGGGGGGVGTYSSLENAPWGMPGVGGNPATDATDETSADPDDPSWGPATGGGAGTDTAGGQGGTGGFSLGSEIPWYGADGGDGSLGAGGDGATDDDDNFGGGGGGAGLYGGGGGAIGSDMLDTAGGGGSSLGDSTEPGINEGDGSVTITPVAECDDEPDDTTTTTVAEPDESTTTTTVPAPTPVAQPAAAVRATPTYTG